MFKLVRNLIIVLVIVSMATVFSVPVAFAYFDQPNYNENVSGLQSGEWWASTVDFESFTNTTSGIINGITINNTSFDINNTVAAATSNDLKNGTTSARIEQIGYIVTTNYLTGVSSYAFNTGWTLDSTTAGAKPMFYVQVSNNGLDYTDVYTNNERHQTLDPFTVDMASLLTAGIAMPDSSTATSATPLKYRIYIDESASKYTRNLNVDDIVISY